jgi:hypothetical protein
MGILISMDLKKKSNSMRVALLPRNLKVDFKSKLIKSKRKTNRVPLCMFKSFVLNYSTNIKYYDQNKTKNRVKTY